MLSANFNVTVQVHFENLLYHYISTIKLNVLIISKLFKSTQRQDSDGTDLRSKLFLHSPRQIHTYLQYRS